MSGSRSLRTFTNHFAAVSFHTKSRGVYYIEIMTDSLKVLQNLCLYCFHHCCMRAKPWDDNKSRFQILEYFMGCVRRSAESVRKMSILTAPWCLHMEHERRQRCIPWYPSLKLTMYTRKPTQTIEILRSRTLKLKYIMSYPTNTVLRPRYILDMTLNILISMFEIVRPIQKVPLV